MDRVKLFLEKVDMVHILISSGDSDIQYMLDGFYSLAKVSENLTECLQ